MHQQNLVSVSKLAADACRDPQPFARRLRAASPDFDNYFHKEFTWQVPGYIKPGGLVESEHEVQVLHRLSGGSFHQIVDAADHHQPLAVIAERAVNVAKVGAIDEPQFAAGCPGDRGG